MNNSTTHAWPLELSTDAMQQMLEQVAKRIISHIASLPEQPAADAENGEAVAKALRETLPDRGLPFSELIDILFDQVVGKSFNSASPGYLAYIPGGGIFHAAVADLISNAVNRYVGVWAAAPGLVQIETNVIRWFCEIVGYPATSGGFLTTGGSLANFSALFTARRDKLTSDSNAVEAS